MVRIQSLMQVVAVAPAVLAQGNFKFSSVTGFFQQDEAATDAATFDYAKSNFGLIDRTYPSDSTAGAGATLWQRFTHHVEQLNTAASSGTSYKVLFLARQGGGVHNAAETHYGTPAWNCYWGKLEGNSTTTWADAKLTLQGEADAKKASDFFASQMGTQKQPAPQSYYVSPLTRCLDTAQLTFGSLSLPADRPFKPVVKELLREGISHKTQDRRGTKSYIQGRYPTWTIEAGFSEADLLWNGTYAEPADAFDQRSQKALDDLFANDSKQIISITSHSGTVASLLRVLGHRAFALTTGQIIVSLVKADKNASTTPTTPVPWQLQSTCNAPPASSGASGCVCAAKRMF